jgi:hypothetical protein
MLRNRIRLVPWLLAIAGLAIPLVGSGFMGWLIVLGWLLALGLVWLVGGDMVPTRGARIVAGSVMLTVLLVPGAWYGGWWLIPALLTWLVIEIADRGRVRAPGVTA